MKWFFKILFLIFAIFQTNLCEAKTISCSDLVLSEYKVSNIFDQQYENVEILNACLENCFAEVCQNERNLVVY